MRIVFKLGSAAATVTALLYATTALAQVAPPQDSAAAEDAGLNDIVVVAQKKSEKLGDVPVSVGVVSGDTLQRLNISSFSQMAREVPSFNVAEGASGNRITLRGISSGTNRGFEQSVGMFIDNIYAGRAAQFSSPFFDVERIEVLKGPQSILFGKNTIAGAVSIITARPTKDQSLVVWGGYETRFRGYNISAVGNQPLADNLQLRIALHRDERSRGILYNTLKKDHEPSTRNTLARASLAWQPGDIDVNAKYEYSENRRVGSLFQIIADGGRGALFTSIDPQFESKLNLQNSVGAPNSDVNQIRAHNLALHVNVPLGSGTLTSDTGYSTYKLDSQREDSDFTPVKLIQYDNHEKFNQFSQEFRFSSASDEPLTYTAGVFFQKQHYISSPFYSITAAAMGLFNVNTTRHFDQHADTYSAFGELGYELVPSLRLIGGARYVAENKKADRSAAVLNYATGQLETDPSILARTKAIFAVQNFALQQEMKERQFTPAVTLQYKPENGLMAYAKFSRGFKSGGFDASDGLGTAQPYESEDVSAWEAGVKWSPNRQVNINLTGFYSRFNNLQSQAFNGTYFVTTNAARASTRGVELETRWRPVQPLTLSGAVTYMDARYDDYSNAACTTSQSAAWTAAGKPGPCVQDLSGRPLMDAPKFSANLNASFEQQLANDWGVRFNVGTNIRSSAYVAPDLDPIGLQKAYATIDSSLEVTSPGDHITFALVGRNLGDVRAKTYLVNNPFFSGTKSASIIEPRTLEVRATVRF